MRCQRLKLVSAHGDGAFDVESDSGLPALILSFASSPERAKTMKRLMTVMAACMGVASAGMGICYDSYDSANMKTHFTTIKERFTAVRTFQTDMGSQNAIDVAADTGLSIAAGIWLLGDRYEKDLKAVIDGCKRHPNTVQVVYVGNEELHNGWNADKVIDKVLETKKRLTEAGVKVRVGTVQIDGDFLSNPKLVDACDVIGVNIHPFFSGAPSSVLTPITDYMARWDAVKAKFGDKVRMTESGWPTEGGDSGQHQANFQRAKDFYGAVLSWQAKENSETPYYFMFHDNKAKGGFEAHFGIATSDGKWKWDQPGPNPQPQPSPSPSNQPSPSPSNQPSPSPSNQPSPSPSNQPSPSPSNQPSTTPSVYPTPGPTTPTPSSQPTPGPTTPRPSSQPTPAPTTPTSRPTPTSTPHYCE
ncbi:hypothetical protein SDRG_08037 [Saprolegnia diclina VS20]|uniref:glucan endo-1,3-beta-D-glucosidase n=1 Tax=Saprolegnia diclina (strain VS20) TaxID=1156394 RepID=T0QKE9_SAPDV|nr:hypothetical protein SDRG_08037 [Saprolegnia diclina VS20]EQC34265.1 hypothetical protein SDRG_08037 [Saprolegnia diclina VS20]|eukprot:XP_008612127.1 hypothetical protein SDRG_08037 [Saprolegnia diclina VS20]